MVKITAEVRVGRFSSSSFTMHGENRKCKGKYVVEVIIFVRYWCTNDEVWDDWSSNEAQSSVMTLCIKPCLQINKLRQTRYGRTKRTPSNPVCCKRPVAGVAGV